MRSGLNYSKEKSEHTQICQHQHRSGEGLSDLKRALSGDSSVLSKSSRDESESVADNHRISSTQSDNLIGTSRGKGGTRPQSPFGVRSSNQPRMQSNKKVGYSARRSTSIWQNIVDFVSNNGAWFVILVILAVVFLIVFWGVAILSGLERFVQSILQLVLLYRDYIFWC